MKFNMLGDANHAGPVRLSDVYSSAVGSAKDGVAASQRALYDAYNSLNSSINSNITHLKNDPISTDLVMGGSINKFVAMANVYSVFKNSNANSATLKLPTSGNYLVVTGPYSGGYLSGSEAIGFASNKTIGLIAGDTTSWGKLTFNSNDSVITLTDPNPRCIIAMFIAPQGKN